MTKVLVAGATGNIGSRVVQTLLEQGVTVRALVRNPDAARAILGQRPEFAVGDFADIASVRRALEGVDRLFLACSNNPRQVEYEIAVAEAAVAKGVRKIVKLSARGAEIGSPVAFWDWHARIEGALRHSGIPVVQLQPSFSMNNLLGAIEGIRREGALVAPAQGAKIGMIHPQDVAAVAALILTSDGHIGNTYVLTGPEAITYDQVAAELSAATGRSIPFIAVPDEAARQAMIKTGMPEFVATQLVTLFAALRQGVYAQTTNTVEALLGRKPYSFTEFAKAHADAFSPYPVAEPAANQE